MEETKTNEIETTEVVNEETNEETTEVVNEETNEETNLKSQIEAIKKAYEEKITKIVKEKDATINEQSKVITQLVTGEETAQTPPTIAEMINKNRYYKKW